MMADNPAAEQKHESNPSPLSGKGSEGLSPVSPDLSALSGLTPERTLDGAQNFEKDSGQGFTNPGREEASNPPYGNMGGCHTSSYGHGNAQSSYLPSHDGRNAPPEKRRRTAAVQEYGRFHQGQSQMYSGGGQHYSQHGGYHYQPESVLYPTQHSGGIDRNQPDPYDTHGAIAGLSARVNTLTHDVRQSQHDAGISYNKMRKEVVTFGSILSKFGKKLDELISSQSNTSNPVDNTTPHKRPRSGSISSARGAGGGAHSSGAKNARSSGAKGQAKGGRTRNSGEVLIPEFTETAATEGSSPEYTTALNIRARVLHNEAEQVVSKFMDNVKAKHGAYKCDIRITFDAPASQYMENKKLAYPCKRRLVLPQGSTMKLWEHIQFCTDIYARFASANPGGDFWVTNYVDKVGSFLTNYKKLPYSMEAGKGLANKTKQHMAYFCALQYEEARKQDPATFRCSSCTAIIRREVALVCTRCCFYRFCRYCYSLPALRKGHENRCEDTRSDFWKVDKETA